MSYGSGPYAPVASVGQVPARGARLAGLDKRFLAVLVDFLVGFVVLIPGYAMMIVSGAASGNGEVGVLGVVGMLWVFVAALALLGLQIYFLATRSQSIGKYFMKTQIVDVNTGLPANFLSCFLLRLFVNGLIAGIPCVGWIYSIVDICYIFREDRRCIHDLIAGTCVVDIS